MIYNEDENIVEQAYKKANFDGNAKWARAATNPLPATELSNIFIEYGRNYVRYARRSKIFAKLLEKLYTH